MVVGVDPSTFEPAVTWTLPNGQWGMEKLFLRKKSGKMGPVVVANAYEKLHTLLGELKQISGVDVAAFIEEPVLGQKQSKRTLITTSYVNGALQAAVLTIPGASLQMLSNTEWKKGFGVSGTAGKPRIARHLQQVWPDAYAQAQQDIDLVDSAGINIYGRLVLSES